MIKSKYFTICFIMFFLSIYLTVLNDTVLASEKERVGFSVRPIYPENQIQSNVSYFNVPIKKDSQSLKVELTSTRIEPVTIDISILNAGTSDKGQIEYVEAGAKRDKSLVDSVIDLTTISNENQRITVSNFEKNFGI